MLAQLFFTFFQIGAFTFGGGYAMVPLIQREVCEKKKWLTEEEFLNCLALAQSAPSITVNTSAYVGYRLKRTLGAICSVLGAVLPSSDHSPHRLHLS